ncbi:type II toxin-antitoxin system PemK/MazF family toxin [Bacillus licheniformis]|uniref:type II toxin-antitoxin system PemK/MazF family toxin n=1 Tax=Bacillus licheniformis TaxID=1402 RepID=UPI001C229AA2|nr:type II toxin-antitoxin system PemK/MazF family toxin [Bacillus licheniformis]MBU8802495.1 type II toxin-antitoxin system PemK/MazF family toxin [Bacillus licheniformis]
MALIKRMVSLIERMANRLNQFDPDKTMKLLDWTIRKFRIQANAHLHNNKVIYRGEVYWCYLGENIGNEESKKRPVVIIQNQKSNDHSPTTIVAPITNATIDLPIAVPINRAQNPNVTGTIDLGQIKVVHKARLIGNSIDKLKNSELKKVDMAIMKSVGTYNHLIREQRKFEQKERYAKSLNQVLSEIKKELGITKNEDILNAIKSIKSK